MAKGEGRTEGPEKKPRISVKEGNMTGGQRAGIAGGGVEVYRFESYKC